MDSLFHLHQPGFSRFVSASFILHIVILVVALFLVHGSQKKIFITPTYTKVNLIAPQVAKKKAPSKKTKQAKAVKKTVAVKKAAVKKPSPLKKKTIALKKEVSPRRP